MTELPADVSPLGSTQSPGEAPIRASDAEREHIAELLTAACGDGRLTLEELGHRVGLAYTAVSRSDLAPLVADLPVVETASVGVGAEKSPRRRGHHVLTVMGSVTRRGHWRLPSRSDVVTVMGETELDLRQAVIEGGEIEMTLYLLMGEQRVIVPQGVEVEVSGSVIMGERRVDVAPVRPRPGVPRLHIRVRGLMGEVSVQTR